MAKDKYGSVVEVGALVRLVDPDDDVNLLPGDPLEVERVFCRDLDDEPLTFKGVSIARRGEKVSTWPSSMVVVVQAGSEADTDRMPHGSDSGAIVIDGQPVVPTEPCDPVGGPLLAWQRWCELQGMPTDREGALAALKEKPLDDLRAIGNDLPISNLHDFSKEQLAQEIYQAIDELGYFDLQLETVETPSSFSPSPSDAEASGHVEMGAVEGEVAPPVIIEEGA